VVYELVATLALDGLLYGFLKLRHAFFSPFLSKGLFESYILKA